MRIPEVDATTAKRWLDAGEAELVDVREPDEHARERIAGAKLVPLSRFDPAAARPRSPRKLVVHCRSGRRSADAITRLPGVEAFNLAGGIEAWKKAGLPLEEDRAVNRISLLRQMQLTVGAGVLTGAARAYWASPWFLVVPALFGAGLLVAGMTGTCGLMEVLARMPWNRGARC
jgi:rhodanese-related sulfurtransferase